MLSWDDYHKEEAAPTSAAATSMQAMPDPGTEPDPVEMPQAAPVAAATAIGPVADASTTHYVAQAAAAVEHSHRTLEMIRLS